MYENYPKDFFKANRVMQYLGGQHIPKSDAKILTKILFNVYNVLLVIYCQFLYTPSETIIFGETAKNPADLIEHLGMLLQHYLGIIKAITWFVRRRTILRVRDVMESDEFKYEDYEDFKPGDIMRSNRRIFNVCVTFFYTVACMVPISKILEGIGNFFVKGHLIDSGNITCQSILPYFAWFPFDTESKSACGYAMIIQILPMMLYAFQIISCDMSFTGLCCCLRAHLIIIRGAFKTIRQRVLKRMQLREDYQVMKDEEDPRLHHEMQKEMKKITIHFQTMINMCDEMETTYTIQTLGQTLVTLFIMVSCLYMISNEPLFSPTFTAEMDYFIGAYVQLGLCCVFGNEIILQSIDIDYGLYEADWFSASQSFKRSMLINMLRIQRPLVLTIGKFTPLTLALLLAVGRGSYSYFTVLKQTS